MLIRKEEEEKKNLKRIYIKIIIHVTEFVHLNILIIKSHIKKHSCGIVLEAFFLENS